MRYVTDSWHRRWFEAPMQPGRLLHLPGEAGRDKVEVTAAHRAAVAGTKHSLC